ncbi:MAG: hypothetical protein K8R58_11330 [Bacteroidales bacterium]|nr:hypothetical protein [Bacteroidales bacterium]
MINNKHNTDDFLKDLIQKTDIESPSDDFTNNIMAKIQPDTETEIITSKIRINIKSWHIAAFSILISLIFLIFYFWPLNNILPENNYFSFLVPIGEKIISLLLEPIANIKISSTTIIVIIAILSLLFVDKLIKRLSFNKTHIFL